MANSSITLTFLEIPAIGTEISVVDTLRPSVSMVEEFVLSRTQTGETPVPVFSPTINSVLTSYSVNLGLDYNNTYLYTITKTATTVTITANNPNSSFVLETNTTIGGIKAAINNVAAPTVLTIDDIQVSQADTSPCDRVKLTITTNEQADSISNPINQVVSSNPFTVTIDRNELIDISVVKDGVTVNDGIKVPKLLSTYFSISKVQTPSNASIVVNNTLPSGVLFNIEYSIDNENWQTSKNFPSLSFGDYTLYVRDDLGCSTSLSYSINDFTPNLLDYDGICEISNINSFRFKEDVVWDDLILKTPVNTLSFEEDVILNNNNFVQLFAKRDIIPTQIKTNFKTLEATLIDESGTETSLFIDKRTNNMNVTDIRDAQIISVTYNDAQYTGVKFSGGKVYDSETLEELTDYNIGENTPSWMNAEDWINIEGMGWYKVLDIVYSEDAYVVVINLLADDSPFVLPITKKITSVYNLVDWENYEFNIDFSNKSGCYKVKIECSDPVFGNKNFLSEWINIKENQENTFLIQSYNTKNNEINFATGFKSTLRIMYEDVLKWKPNTTQEIHITDTRTTTLENTYRGFWELKATPLPTAMAEKLIMILSQDRLFINNINYVLDGEVDSENLGDTNLYEIKANLVKANYVFNSNSGKYIDLNNIEGTLLSISNEGGFLRVD